MERADLKLPKQVVSIPTIKTLQNAGVSLDDARILKRLCKDVDLLLLKLFYIRFEGSTVFIYSPEFNTFKNRLVRDFEYSINLNPDLIHSVVKEYILQVVRNSPNCINKNQPS